MVGLPRERGRRRRNPCALVFWRAVVVIVNNVRGEFGSLGSLDVDMVRGLGSFLAVDVVEFLGWWELDSWFCKGGNCIIMSR